MNDRELIKASALIRALEFIEGVEVRANGNGVSIDVRDEAVVFSGNDDAGMFSSDMFHAGADERSLSFKKRDGLALHISAHESAVSVVVFKEGNESGGDRDDLFRANVHKVDLISREFRSIFMKSGGDGLVKEEIVKNRFISLSDDKFFFFKSVEEDDLIRDFFMKFIDYTVRGFYEAEFINDGEIRKRADEADIGPFRSFDGAHSAVVRDMDVANFEAGAFTREPAGPESGESAFMS